MASVAVKRANNPMAGLSKHIPIDIVPIIDLPNKILLGNAMIGLGDLALPGLVISYALKFDKYKSGKSSNGYFLSAMLGYSIGLLIAAIIMIISRHPQPALLYLVPCTILPLLLLAYSRKEINDIWRGINPGLKNTDV